MRKEGVTIGLKAVNMHPAQAGGRFLHGRSASAFSPVSCPSCKRLPERHCEPCGVPS